MKAIFQLMTFPCMHTDETSLRVNKQNHWIHMYSAGDLTLKFLHRKRGKEAMEDIAIIPNYGGGNLWERLNKFEISVLLFARLTLSGEGV